MTLMIDSKEVACAAGQMAELCEGIAHVLACAATGRADTVGRAFIERADGLKANATLITQMHMKWMADGDRQQQKETNGH